jgi:hypothetical protein
MQGWIGCLEDFGLAWFQLQNANLFCVALLLLYVLEIIQFNSI